MIDPTDQPYVSPFPLLHPITFMSRTMEKLVYVWDPPGMGLHLHVSQIPGTYILQVRYELEPLTEAELPDTVLSTRSQVRSQLLNTISVYECQVHGPSDSVNIVPRGKMGRFRVYAFVPYRPGSEL